MYKLCLLTFSIKPFLLLKELIILDKLQANGTHNPTLLLRKMHKQYTALLIHTCFVMLLKGVHTAVCMYVCILATQRATLAGLLWHSIYCLVIWGLCFSLHPKFLCPCDKN